MSSRPEVSIVIPTLNEAGVIGSTLDSLESLRGDFEVIVADGGSTDGTQALVAARQQRLPRSSVVQAPLGRGPQLNRGAAGASGDVLLFLHADTLLSSDALEAIRQAVADPEVAGGNFTMVCGGETLSSLVFTWLNAIRRWFGIYYGDSAIWVRRRVYDEIGGFVQEPLMEDFDFCRKLERAGRTVCLPSTVVTSPRRWSGWRAPMAVFLWTLVQWLYTLGVSPSRLARLYYPGSRPWRRRGRRCGGSALSGPAGEGDHIHADP